MTLLDEDVHVFIRFLTNWFLLFFFNVQGGVETKCVHVHEGRFIRMDDMEDIVGLLTEMYELSKPFREANVQLKEAERQWKASLGNKRKYSDRRTKVKSNLEKAEQENLRINSEYRKLRATTVDFLIRAFFYGGTYISAGSRVKGAHWILFTKKTMDTIMSKCAVTFSSMM